LSKPATRQWESSISSAISELAVLPESCRNARIGALLADHFSAEKARDALREFEQQMAPLCKLGNFGLFVIFFMLVPVAFWRVGAQWPFFVILGAGWVLMLASATLFFRAHRRLAPARGNERWQHTILAALIPQHALRAPQVLARERLATFHPLAVAVAVLKPEMSRDFAARLWRDAVHPLPLEGESSAVDVAREFHQEYYLPALQAALIQAGYQPADLLAPSGLDAQALAYCPRCHGSFARTDAVCEDCGMLTCRAHPSG
jgi:hypothetical protein